MSLKLIKLNIVLPLANRDAAICGKRKNKRTMTSKYNITNKKNSISLLNDYSKIHIYLNPQAQMVGDKVAAESPDQ